MTAALEGFEGSASHPGRSLLPGKTWYPFYRRLGGPQGRSGRAKNLVPTGIRSRTVQPVVSRYSDWATRPTYLWGTSVYFYRSFPYTIISHPTETTQQLHYNGQLIKCCREATSVDCHNHATHGATSIVRRNVTLRRHALGCNDNKSVRHVTVLI